MPELKEKPLASKDVIPEYEAVTVQLKNQTEIFGQVIDRVSSTMTSIALIDVQKDWVLIWPTTTNTSVKGYVKIPMTAVRAIKYQQVS